MLKLLNQKDMMRRPFEITIGLKEEYEEGKVHEMEKIQQIILDWMQEQKKFGRPVIAGKLDYNVFLHLRENPIIEDVAVWKGEVNPITNGHVSDKAILDSLRELADILARRLKQKRIHLSYRDQIFVYEHVSGGKSS